MYYAHREVGVLQVLGAADGHLKPAVEHLEPETETRNKRVLMYILQCVKENI